MRTLKIPRKYETASIRDVHDEELRKKLYGFLKACEEHGRPLGITIYGPNGTGKTYVATALARFLYGLTMVLHPPVFVRAAEMVELWNEEDDYRQQTYRSTFRTCELLVLDDLGKEDHTTEYRAAQAVRIVGSVLRSRVQAGLATIITMNVEYDAVEEKYGKSVKSLLHESSESFLLINGPDKRLF